jgi:hypothetical protein
MCRTKFYAKPVEDGILVYMDESGYPEDPHLRFAEMAGFVACRNQWGFHFSITGHTQTLV